MILLRKFIANDTSHRNKISSGRRNTIRIGILNVFSGEDKLHCTVD